MSQPAPTGNGQIVMELLLKDLDDRYQHGLKEYGTPLRAFNGRDSLQDAYEEVLDLALYLRQAIYERDNAKVVLTQTDNGVVKAVLTEFEESLGRSY